MKFNWGPGIAIFYGLFMAAMLTFVVKARNVDHSLVMDNYYEEDINYQKHMDKVANSKNLAVDLSIAKIGTNEVQLQFPEVPGDISGEVWFYRPNDNSRDLKIPLDLDANRLFSVSTAELLPGRWKLKVEWQAGNKGFYKEKELYL